MPIFANDPALLRDFRAGRPEALERVYRAYVDKIEDIVRFGFTRRDNTRLSGVGISAIELEDLVHEVFSRVFAPAARQAFDGVRPFGPYLFATTRNVLAGWGRRAGREVPTDVAGLESAMDEWTEAPPIPYADEVTVSVVERFIADLPPELRALHEKRMIEGLSQRDAAEALGITRQVLRTMEGKLRTMLREALALEEQPNRDLGRIGDREGHEPQRR